MSVAASTRQTRNGISIGMVYTPPEHRCRGYATACVAELTRVLLHAGHSYCALFADQENPASNRVYQKVGYRSICDYDEYTFSDTGRD